MYNKELAGKEINVSKDIISSGKLSFDEFGNAKGELSKEAEEKLLTIPGFAPGKSDAKESLVDVVSVDEPEQAEDGNKVADLEEELAKTKEENAELAKKVAGLEEELKLAEAKLKAKEEVKQKAKQGK